MMKHACTPHERRHRDGTFLSVLHRIPPLFLFLLLIVLLLSLLPAPSGGAGRVETQGVVATIKPLQALVQGVVGDTGEVDLIVAGTASPHDFQLRPSQVRLVQDAAIVFYIDDNFETFLLNTFAVAPASVRLYPVSGEDGLIILDRRDVHHSHGRDHGHGDEHEDEHEDDYDHDYERPVSSVGHDFHLWLDPDNAKKIITAAVRELSALYPENMDVYEQNARAMTARIEAQSARLTKELAEVRGKPYMVFHDAYQYFERYYGLSWAGSLTLEPDEFPSAGRLGDIRHRIREANVVCVFTEPQFSGRLVAAATEGLDIKTGVFDPLGADAGAGPDSYFHVLDRLAANLKECLS